MHPILFEIPAFHVFSLAIGPIEIRWYGVMIAVGFLSAVHLAAFRARRLGLDPDAIVDVGIWVLVAALIGSRVFYVVAEWDEYEANPMEVLMFWRGGLVFYGGLLTAIPVGVLLVRRKKLPLGEVANLSAPCIALGHGLGRIGCFLNGCCFGIPTEGPWGVVFGPGSSAWDYFGGPRKVHPANLYEALGELILFASILFAERWRWFRGRQFALYLFAYGALRMVLEGIREGSPAILLGLTGSQIISVLLMGSGIIIVSRSASLYRGSTARGPLSRAKQG